MRQLLQAVADGAGQRLSHHLRELTVVALDGHLAVGRAPRPMRA
jgi:hypothetical protein